MVVDFAVCPIETPAQFNGLGQPLSGEIEVDGRARTPTKLVAKFGEIEVLHSFAILLCSG